MKEQLKYQMKMTCFRCCKKLNVKYLIKDTEYEDLKEVNFNLYCLRCSKKRKDIDKELCDFYWEIFSKLEKLKA
jgi:hypothetical protein